MAGGALQEGRKLNGRSWEIIRMDALIVSSDENCCCLQNSEGPVVVHSSEN